MSQLILFASRSIQCTRVQKVAASDSSVSRKYESCILQKLNTTNKPDGATFFPWDSEKAMSSAKKQEIKSDHDLNEGK